MIFELDTEMENVKPLEETYYTELNIKEDLIETLIEKRPYELLDEEILIIGKQVQDWDETNERCDLLGIDKNGKLVVIEVKRDGNQHRDKDVTIQSIKYASYFSTYKFQDVIDNYRKYSNSFDRDEQIKRKLMSFINREEDFIIDNDPRIIIIGRAFPQEVTASVLWLKEHNIDIKCITIIPYKDNNGHIYINRKTIIPLKETNSYMVHRKEKDDSIKSEQDEKNKQKFKNFILDLNNKLYEKIPELKEIGYKTDDLTYCFYGNYKYHYEIHVPRRGRCINVAFHFEGNFDLKILEEFESKFDVILKEKGFNNLRGITNTKQKGYVCPCEIPCKFLELDDTYKEDVINEISKKFAELYNTISDYVNSNIFGNRQDSCTTEL